MKKTGLLHPAFSERLISSGYVNRLAAVAGACSSGCEPTEPVGAMLAKVIDRVHRLHEQERGKPEGFPRLGA